MGFRLNQISFLKATFVLFLCSGSVCECPHSAANHQRWIFAQKSSGWQRSIAIISVHISVKPLRFMHSSSPCLPFPSSRSKPPLSGFVEYVNQPAHSLSLFNLSSKDGPHLWALATTLISPANARRERGRERAEEEERLLSEHAGLFCIRGSFTLTCWLLTLAHRAGTVLRHITVSIWHCLLCLMPTHMNTHACAQTTPDHTSQPQTPWDQSTGDWQSWRLVTIQDKAETKNGS